MKLLIASFVLITLAILSSCGVYYSQDYTLIKIGMTTEEVIAIAGKPIQIVAAKKYDDGILEIYEYPSRPYRTDTLLNWYHFIDNKLEEWGPKEQYAPSDYDRYYHKYRRNNR
ncbi:hypothetical protein [Sphingobacterium bovisgrunnientis]|jgi:hypothetical protein|uniref:hypothetical protein n=1 Tax=Sphingobacterium bovisgrunnientis TaxID=1874697 RepID=UPI00135C67CA|nr:hypothetical protein [Sphingobacterium bovisgrunnientis]